MTVAATAPRRPRNAHASEFGTDIDKVLGGSANSNRADLTKGHALTHTRSPRSAIHFRPLGVGEITIRRASA